MNKRKSPETTLNECKEIYVEESDPLLNCESTKDQINASCRISNTDSEDAQSNWELENLKRLSFKQEQTGRESPQDEDHPKSPSKRSQTGTISENCSSPMLMSPSRSKEIWMPSRRDHDSDSSFGKNWILLSNTRHILTFSQD